MRAVEGWVGRFCRGLDNFAALCIVGVMLLVVSNVILKGIFKSPILGTFEYVSLFTAIGIGFALANCALQGGHIAVSFLVEKLSNRIQAVIDVFVYSTSAVFWALSAWYVAQHGHMMTTNSMVAATTQIPLSPFVYLISVGLFGLCLVLFINVTTSLRKALK